MLAYVKCKSCGKPVYTIYLGPDADFCRCDADEKA